MKFDNKNTSNTNISPNISENQRYGTLNKPNFDSIDNYQDKNETKFLNIGLEAKKQNVKIETSTIKRSQTKFNHEIELQKYQLATADETNEKSSNRTVKDDIDNLAFLTTKYLTEKEDKLKKEAEERIQRCRELTKKKFTKKLITFKEAGISHTLKILDFIICFFILSDVSLSVYTNSRFTVDELDLNDKFVKERFAVDQEIEDLRLCIMGIIGIIEMLIIAKYLIKVNLLRSSLHASKNDNIFTTSLFKPMILEMVVLVVFTPPQINGYFQGDMLFGYYTYSSDSFILLAKIFKLYYLAIIYSHLALWTSERATEIAKENKASIGANFAFKATFKATPCLFILILLVFTIILMSFMLRIFEYGFSQDAGDKMIASAKAIKNAQFDSYIDVVWVVIITLLTVGYGDIFPKTHLGRLIAFFSSIIGMIITSLLVVKLTNFVELTVDEKKAFNDIKKSEDLKKLKLYSSNLIKTIFKLVQIKIDKDIPRDERYFFYL